MITVRDVVDFLVGRAFEIGLNSCPSMEIFEEKIHLPSTVLDAKEGCISWLKFHDPKQVLGYRGTLLLTDLNLSRPNVLACDKPRLAMIYTINEFFSELAVDRESVFAGEVDIGRFSVVMNCLGGKNIKIGSNCSIGLRGFGYERTEKGWLHFPHIGRVVLGSNVEIDSNVGIDRGTLGDTVIGDGTKIDNLCHIAHNVRIGKNCILTACVKVCGSVTIGDDVWIAPGAALLEGITVGNGALIGLGAVVLRDVEERAVMVGNPARRIR